MFNLPLTFISHFLCTENDCILNEVRLRLFLWYGVREDGVVVTWVVLGNNGKSKVRCALLLLGVLCLLFLSTLFSTKVLINNENSIIMIRFWYFIQVQSKTQEDNTALHNMSATPVSMLILLPCICREDLLYPCSLLPVFLLMLFTSFSLPGNLSP